MGAKSPDLGNEQLSLGALQEQETDGNPEAVSGKAGDFIYCLPSRQELEKGEVVIWRRNRFAHEYFTVRIQGHL